MLDRDYKLKQGVVVEVVCCHLRVLTMEFLTKDQMILDIIKAFSLENSLESYQHISIIITARILRVGN